ncbi:MAG: FAD-dependent thymidylate synthase [Nitrososphaerota archaeon]|nr:FAD-dependent thymidylate synthase [Nitrososphaerota archaeon]MDG6943000.1 FAD-dependent thymidylate synthase [Nitrososphaerota archaeon]MDG6950729.1 FAD-dependent thymidylate synthase [Nitrososphaerota archaeon]
MRVSLLWSSPYPERTIAAAMRRCYSTKTIEEIETELEQKGEDYWKYLLTKALQDKSLDVFEHFTLTLLVEEAGDTEVGSLVRDFPYLRATRVKDADWFVSMNARTLVELWRGRTGRGFAELVVAELASKSVCPVFSKVAFGGGTHSG